MQITTLAQVQERPRRVAVGEFDGVHLGHREVIRGSDTVRVNMKLRLPAKPVATAS